MPQLRRYTEDEVRDLWQTKERGQRDAISIQYDALLAEFAGGEWGEAELSEDENKQTVRYRLKQAAKRRDLEIEFIRVRKPNIIMFKLLGNGRLDLDDDAELDKVRVDGGLPEEEVADVPF